MAGTFWTDEQEAQLIEAWRARRADITAQEFAREHQAVFRRSINAITQKLKGYPEYKVPPSNRTPWVTPPRMEGDAFILGDTQIPFHHAEFINKCLELCRRWNIRQMALGGDALDINALSSFTPDFENDNRRVIDSRSADALLKFADHLPAKKRDELLDIIGESERENGVGGEIKESRVVLKSLEDDFDRIVWVMATMKSAS